MQTNCFRVNKNEYCHITDDLIFINSGKDDKRIPPPHELSEAWGIASVFNYIFFVFLLGFIGIETTIRGNSFFMNPINYGAVFLLFMSLRRIQQGLVTSKTSTIGRNKIKSVSIKTPMFSFPRVEIYFDGPEGKVLRRSIPILYKKEAHAAMEAAGLVK